MNFLGGGEGGDMNLLRPISLCQFQKHSYDGARPFCACNCGRALSVLACHVVLVMYHSGSETQGEVYLIPTYLRLARVKDDQ